VPFFLHGCHPVPEQCSSAWVFAENGMNLHREFYEPLQERFFVYTVA